MMDADYSSPQEPKWSWRGSIALLFNFLIALLAFWLLANIPDAVSDEASSEWMAFTGGNHIWDIAAETFADGYRLWVATDGGVFLLEQSPAGIFSHTITTLDGLASNNVRAIAIDRQGHKWFGTDSGVSLLLTGTYKITRTFTSADGLAADDVYAIAIDRQGHKWFGTESGLSIWLTGTNQITSTCQGLNDCRVRAIAVDAQDNKWIGTWGGGLSVIPPGVQHGVITYTFGIPGVQLGSNYIHTIAIDAQGYKWIGNLSGVSVFDDRGSPLVRGGDRWKQIITNTQVLDILVDPHNMKWLGTRDDGIIALSDRGDPFFSTCQISFRTDPENPQSLSGNHVPAIAFTQVSTHTLYWFGTWGHGLSTLDGFNAELCPQKTGVWGRLTSGALSRNDVRALLIDSEGNKWFGTWGGGVSLYIGREWRTFNVSSGIGSNYVNDLALQGDYKWLALRPAELGERNMTGGLAVWDDHGSPLDPGDDHWLTYTRQAMGALPSDWVETVAVDPEGNKWFGTYSSGVAVLRDGGTPFVITDDLWITYTVSNSSLSSNWIRDIGVVTETTNTLKGWFCTLGSGVCGLTTTTSFSPTHWFTYTVADGLASNDVWCMAIDQQRRKWFGTDRGVSVLDDSHTITTTNIWRTSDNCRNIRAIAFDREGRAWCATEGEGVCVLDRHLNLLGRYTTRDGLASNLVWNVGIEYLITDTLTTVKWFATRNGVSRFTGAPSWPTPTPTVTATESPTMTPTVTSSPATPRATGTPTRSPTASPATGTPTLTPSALPTSRVHLPLVLRAIN